MQRHRAPRKPHTRRLELPLISLTHFEFDGTRIGAFPWRSAGAPRSDKCRARTYHKSQLNGDTQEVCSVDTLSAPAIAPLLPRDAEPRRTTGRPEGDRRVAVSVHFGGTLAGMRKSTSDEGLARSGTRLAVSVVHLS